MRRSQREMGSGSSQRRRWWQRISMAMIVALAASFVALPGAGRVHAAGTAAPGYTASDFATGFGSSNGIGPVGVAFDASDNLFAMDYATGYLYKFGTAGGTASSPLNATAITDAPAGLAFGKDGSLYLARQGAEDVVQLNPIDGSIIREVATGITRATGLATDPISGDLFVTNGGWSSNIWRIANPSGCGTNCPTTVYASPGGTDGITFSPDGTLYAATNVCATRITGTNQPQPATVTTIACVGSMDGIALAPSNDPSKPYVFTNDNDGTITEVDQTTSPVTQTQIVTGGTRGDFVAVDSHQCLYATQSDSIEKVTKSDGTCIWQPTGVLSTPSQAPNPPQDVANFQGQGARQIYVTWQAPQPNGAQIDHYNIVEIHADGTPGVVVDSVSATTLSDTISSTASLSINPCEYYRFGVVAVGSDGQQSSLAYPSAPAFAVAQPTAPPKTVAILVQGVGSHIDKGTFNPLGLGPSGYCTSFDGISPVGALLVPSEPAPLESMIDQWMNMDNPSATAPYGAGNNMIDSLASAGAVVLPFSYNGGGTLSGTATSPSFQINSYTGSVVANTSPDAAASALNSEIASIRKVWSNTHIVLIGHSNGGLIAERWWLQFGATGQTQGVLQAFSLDSPLNGVANPSCLAFPGACTAGGVGPILAHYFDNLWHNQYRNDLIYSALDDQSHLFTAIGTIGDPVYDFGDALASETDSGIGIVSQMYFTGSSCQKTGWSPSSSGCTMLGHGVLCPTQNDGTASLFGLPSSIYIHSLAKNCSVAIRTVMSYLQP